MPIRDKGRRDSMEITVKELLDFLKDCPEDAAIRVKNSNTSDEYAIDENDGLFYFIAGNLVYIYIH